MTREEKIADWLNRCQQHKIELAKNDAELNGLIAETVKTDIQISESLERLQKLIDESNRVADLFHNSAQTLDAIDEEFERRVALTKCDIGFLFVATALQILRQFFVTYFKERPDDQTAAKQVHNGEKETSQHKHRYYNPSREQIISNPVPFDAIIGSNGALKGGGKLGHRATAIGHDPLAGLIVGTANIATATLTTSLTNYFQSYHVRTVNKRDIIEKHASTIMVLKHTSDKLLHQGWKGKEIIGCSLVKEIIHLRSDINSKNSLPLPLVSTFSPSFASDLAEYGLDMANVTTVINQATLSATINTLIAMIHKMFYDRSVDGTSKLYEVRTRKILCYSNMIASASNIIYVAVASYLGDAEAVRKLDIGGFLVTLYRMFTDIRFIGALKREFIAESFNEKVKGNFDYGEYEINTVRN